MKGQFKGFTVGLLIGVLVLSGVVAMATGGLQTLENVKVGGIRIVIDNKEFTCTDANGDVVEPMIYNGTTYLPVRAVATAFGKAVQWDGEESTVYLGDMDGKLKSPTAKLVDLENIAYNKYSTVQNVFDNYDNFYNSAIHCAPVYSANRNTSCEVLLNKKYSKFKATLFIPKGTKWDEEDVDYLTFIGDEKQLYKSQEMTKTSEAINIEIDVTDVNDFKIIFNKNDGIRIANAGFYQ